MIHRDRVKKHKHKQLTGNNHEFELQCMKETAREKQMGDEYQRRNYATHSRRCTVTEEINFTMAKCGELRSVPESHGSGGTMNSNVHGNVAEEGGVQGTHSHGNKN
jgi:hypothetical protein